MVRCRRLLVSCRLRPRLYRDIDRLVLLSAVPE
jgi:hypothetical protein